MKTIKIQVRDAKGGLLAYNNDCKTIEFALELQAKYAEQYKGFIHVISINFFY